ncbi:hypothetical protein Ahy_A01g002836 isoform C [Arachis hypogaea]|uniref:Uncharacterized protein n=2 Tax=Arachis hypogaea TaxID=3818 RepID=A0A445ERJ1_ARAHY|nr:hypothetical protein Ahy_A01g002836 isoform C [Arachis hypogaea]
MSTTTNQKPQPQTAIHKAPLTTQMPKRHAQVRRVRRRVGFGERSAWKSSKDTMLLPH